LRVLEGLKQSFWVDHRLIIETEEMLKTLKETGTLDPKAFDCGMW